MIVVLALVVAGVFAVSVKPAAALDRLTGEQYLYGGNSLVSSPRGLFRLDMQTDGNLVLYGGSNAVLWSSYTYGYPGAFAKLGGDGNFVIYYPTALGTTVLWKSDTGGNWGSTLVMQWDGNLVIYNPSSAPIWNTNTPALGIWSYDLALGPAPGMSWNGYKVYLSSPRHSDSRSRGECGWEENANGHLWNYFAATGGLGVSGLDIRSRGYQVTVSANTRDNGYLTNRTNSNNWGANLHLVTHTNAATGCGNATQYLLVMYRSGNANSIAFRDQLLGKLDPVVPGSSNTWNCDTLAECGAAASYRAYVELFFHTSSSTVTNWYQAGGQTGNAVANAWQYGYAIDTLLGYPR